MRRRVQRAHFINQVCDAYYDAHGLPAIHLRPDVIAGDGINSCPSPPEAATPPGWRFIYIDPRDVAQAAEAALATRVTHRRYHNASERRDSLFEWQSAARQLGYTPVHSWLEIPHDEVSA